MERFGGGQGTPPQPVSGGQQQGAHWPAPRGDRRLVWADEQTGNLDSDTSREVSTCSCGSTGTDDIRSWPHDPAWGS